MGNFLKKMGRIMRIGIAGGGPGGLFVAHLLETFCAELCECTIFEASDRLGGKVVTTHFETAKIMFEAGVAEIYDYSHFGPDPIRKLVEKLGLETVPMAGDAVILGNVVLNNDKDIKKHFGAQTLKAVRDFYELCTSMFPPSLYYEGHWLDDNNHPWAHKTFREVLDDIPDEIARKYIEVAVRSDLATEPHLTNALDGLKNILMDDPDYLRTYSIKGGNDLLIKRLAGTLKSRVILDTPVVHVGKSEGGKYLLTTRHKGQNEVHEFDLIVLAMPNYWLECLDWQGRDLRMAMQKHLAHYDYPAHYLRVTILFEEVFWSDVVQGSFFMSDAFGGCCIYDEGSRHAVGNYGVLGWLLAGNDAMALSNLSDDKLIGLALDSLPESLAHGRSLFVEGRVQRWIGTLNGQPGGDPVRPLRERHLPSPDLHPGLFVVGDYLFDSTLNAAFDSADFVTDLIQTELRRHKFAYQFEDAVPVVEGPGAGPLAHDYFKLYDGERTYEDSFEEYFCAEHTTDLIQAVWGWKAPYTLLDVGSANGLTLKEFADFGVEAWGIENNAAMHAQTAKKWLDRNFLGDVCHLPFEDGAFDFVYETCLCYLPPDKLDAAIKELYRVCRVGVYFGSITSDMTMEVIEEHDLFEGVQSLMTLWEWSETFIKNGFRPASISPKALAKAWKIETEANEGDFAWYPDMDAMRCCFYSRPDAPNAPGKEERKLAVKRRVKAGVLAKMPAE